ncbi:transporter substrate-binding domain-containing protein [Desulfococcaceae bacterium OttesenSCG-928-F15]|nr:transporter substrate-binding domain-containing protein [Desulfococcaceae bacterium OttesenSCG-928-F15]
MVKKIIFWAVACLLVFSAGAYAEDSWEKVERVGKLVVGFEDGFPPVTFREADGSLAGFDIDAARALTERLGISVELKTTAWEGIVYRLNAKEFDCIWNGMTITEERSKEVLFTRPYAMTGCVAYTRIDEKLLSSYKDLAGKIIGVRKGSTAVDAANSIPNVFRVVEYLSIEQGFQDIHNKKIDAFVVENVVGNHFMNKQPELFKRLEGWVTIEPFGIAFRRPDVQLRDRVQKELDAMLEDGTLIGFSMKWFGEDLVSPEKW